MFANERSIAVLCPTERMQALQHLENKLRNLLNFNL